MNFTGFNNSNFKIWRQRYKTYSENRSNIF